MSAVRLVKTDKAPPFTPEQVAWIEAEIDRRTARERTTWKRFLLGLRRLVLSVAEDFDEN